MPLHRSAVTLAERFPARVLRDGDARASDTQLLDILKDRAPEIEDNADPYFFAAEISNGSIDAYYTCMQASSLRNYAAAADEGIALLSGHDTKKLPLGKSLTGKYTRGGGERLARVTADFYTLPGLNINGVNTDELIRAIRGGIVSDVSIGFYDGKFICTICERDMMEWNWDNWRDNCFHIPGVEYEVLDADGEPTGERRLCIANVEDAKLAETSVVYDGATPGASITKAMLVAETGHMSPDLARRIETHYHNRFKLPLPAPIFPGGTTRQPSTRGEETQSMTDMRSRAIATDDSRVVEPASDATPEITAAATSEATPEVTAAETNDRKVVDENQAIPTLDPLAGSTSSVPSLEPLPSSGEGPELSAVSGGGQMSTDSGTRASEGADEEMTLRAELREILQGSGIADLPEDPVTAVRALNAELHRLRPLADDGRAYRAELTDETVELGIKAFGDTFPAEQRRAMFAKLELSDIRGFRDEYRAIADKVLPEGRASHETDQSPGEPSEMAPGIGMQTRDRSTLPVDAFVA